MLLRSNGTLSFNSCSIIRNGPIFIYLVRTLTHLSIYLVDVKVSHFILSVPTTDFYVSSVGSRNKAYVIDWRTV